MNNDNPASNNPPDSNVTTPPAGDSPAAPAGNPPAGSSETVKMAEELGRLRKMEEDYKVYREKTEPVLETLWSDQELLNKANEVHARRTGQTPPAGDPPKDPATDPKLAKIENDVRSNRNFAVTQVVNKFTQDRGIDKLPQDKQKEMNTKVGAALRDMLDPMGNKTLAQVLEDADINKLPIFLDNAFTLANREEMIENAKILGRQEAQREGLGVIGSVPSTTPEIEQMSLTPQQKQVAKKMGISEDAYLKNVKEIAARDNQLY